MISRAALLATAKASPEAAGRHDKAGWLSLFSADAVVEDPVGSAPHRRRGAGDDAALGCFYDAFIAPNGIVFDVVMDIVVPGAVVRDVVIEVTAPSGLITRVPTYILYEIVEEDGRPKIARLAAHWELAAMLGQVIRQGWSGLAMSMTLGLRMLRCLGPAGTVGYARAFSGIGEDGKLAAQRLADSFATRNPGALAALLQPDTRIELPAPGRRLDAEAAVKEVGQGLTISGLIAAGFSVAFRFHAQPRGVSVRGIGILQFDPASRRIERARLFWDAPEDR